MAAASGELTDRGRNNPKIQKEINHTKSCKTAGVIKVELMFCGFQL